MRDGDELFSSPLWRNLVVDELSGGRDRLCRTVVERCGPADANDASRHGPFFASNDDDRTQDRCTQNNDQARHYRAEVDRRRVRAAAAAAERSPFATCDGEPLDRQTLDDEAVDRPSGDREACGVETRRRRAGSPTAGPAT